MLDFLRSFLAPSTKQSIFRTERSGASAVSRVFGGLLTCLVVVGLLSSGRLVSMAERQEYGEGRDRWLSAAHALDRTAAALSLDRPARAIDSALGRSTSSSTIILGELAAGSGPLVDSAGPTSTTAAPTTTTTSEPPTAPESSTVQTTAPTTTTTEPPTTTTTTVFGTVDVNRPLRVWIGGDSLGEYVGSRLLYRVADPATTDVELDFHISTGLARPDYFDWPGRISELMQQDERPQAIVFLAGGNDDQDMLTDNGRAVFGSQEWAAEYRRRVAIMMDITAYPGTQMIWINLPPMRDQRRNELSLLVNQILDEEAAIRPWVAVTDVVPLLSGPDGGFEQFLAAPDGDTTVRARANDGIHVTAAASEWVAGLVWTELNRSWFFDASAVATTTPPPEPEPEPTTEPADSAGSTTG